MPGSSPFFSRTFAPITELRQYAPDMQLLAMDTTNLEAEATMQLVGAWLSKFGPELKGLILAGDDFPMTGTLEALKKAGRTDVIIVAAGNSKTGMDSVKVGRPSPFPTSPRKAMGRWPCIPPPAGSAARP